MDFSQGFYDERWAVWDDMKLYGPTARHTRRLVFGMLNRLSFDSVLDAGCGTGVLLYEIGRNFPHARLTGSEFSAAALEVARHRLPASEFFSLDLARQKLDRQFDLITCIDVLEHIDEDEAALSNLRSMTAKYLVLSVPLGPLVVEEQERMGHAHGYERGELEKKLRKAGFDIVNAVQWGFPFYNLHRRFINRMPEGAAIGKFGGARRIFASFLYWLFYLSLPFWGERYYVLCRPGKA